MATPVGHMLAGASAAVGLRPEGPTSRRLAVGGLLGASADLDFVPGLLLGDPARFHHGPSHSLGFALLVAALLWVLVSRDRWRWALVGSGAYATHLLLDFLTVDPSSPVGIPLLWPLSDAYLISPVTPLPRVLHSSVSVLNPHNVGVALLEVVLFGGLLWLCIRWTLRRESS